MLPLLCPEIHILLLVALPSLSCDLGVEGEGKKKLIKLVPFLHFCISTRICKATIYIFCAKLYKILNKHELHQLTKILKQLVACRYSASFIKASVALHLLSHNLFESDGDADF